MVETNKEIISLTYDFMFKALFGNPKNIKILTRFLSDYFNIDYEVLEGKVKILNNELIKNNDYNETKKCIQINFNTFSITQEKRKRVLMII